MPLFIRKERYKSTVEFDGEMSSPVRGEKRPRLNHTFEQLLSDTLTGPSSVLADEDFWRRLDNGAQQGTVSGEANGTETGGDQVIADGSLIDESLVGLIDELPFDLPIEEPYDCGIFGNAQSHHHCESFDVLLLKTASVILSGCDDLGMDEAKRLFEEGVLEEVVTSTPGHTHHLINLLLHSSPSIEPSAIRLIERFITAFAAGNDPLLIEKLWAAWDIDEYLLKAQGNLEKVRVLLGLYTKVLSIWYPHPFKASNDYLLVVEAASSPRMPCRRPFRTLFVGSPTCEFMPNVGESLQGL